MASGMVLPRYFVRASHIWKFCTGGEGLSEFCIDEGQINSERNGLLLAEGIELAFDEKRIAFFYNFLHDRFELCVLDGGLLDQPIVTLDDRGRQELIRAAQGLQKADDVAIPTFREIEGHILECPEGHVPFRRLLAWHYRCSVNPLPATRRYPKRHDVAPRTDPLDDEEARNGIMGRSPSSAVFIAAFNLASAATATPTGTTVAPGLDTALLVAQAAAEKSAGSIATDSD
jgi:hypothetical protein